VSSGAQHIQTDDLSAYIDGFVEERDRTSIAGHLATCAECWAELAELRATLRLLNALPVFPPGRSFQLGPEHATLRPPKGVILTLLPVARGLSVAAAIAFLVVTGAFLFDSTDADNRSSNVVFTEATSETTKVSGETDSPSDSSESAEDVGNYSSAAARDQAGESQQQGGLIDRGNAASAGDGPMADAAVPDESQPAQSAGAAPGDQAEPDSIAQNAPAQPNATSGSTAVATADERQIPWGKIAFGIGAATTVLVGLWLTLARIARSTIRSGT